MTEIKAEWVFVGINKIGNKWEAKAIYRDTLDADRIVTVIRKSFTEAILALPSIGMNGRCVEEFSIPEGKHLFANGDGWSSK